MPKGATEDLETIDEQTGSAPETRLRDVPSAVSLFEKFREGDRDSAYNRAAVQAMLDGEPPYDEHELIAAGQGDRCNINWDEGGAALEHSMAAYVDMLQSVETLGTGHTTWGEDKDLRLEWETGIWEEITIMLKDWGDYFPNYLLNTTYFVSQGVSFLTWDDPIDWRFDVSRLGEVFVPKRAKASEEKLPIVFRRKQFEVHELWAKIKNEDAAKDMGWFPERVKEQILRATEDYETNLGSDWERWVEDVKNNDIHTMARSKVCNLVYAFVKEFDGRVSMFIFPEDAYSKEELTNKDLWKQKNGGWLFKKVGWFDNMKQALISYCYGIGTNGFFHSIRGLGYKIFPHVQAMNRLNCQGVDGAMVSSSLLLTSQDESDFHRAAMSFMGPYAMLAPGLSPAGASNIPNVAQNVMPMVGQIREMVRQKTVQYTPQDAFPEGKDMTRFETSARLEEAASLSVTAFVLFFEQEDKKIKEIVRRITWKDYVPEMPGGEEVAELKKRIKARGIPLEAFYNLDLKTVKAVRAIGNGSAVSRDMILRELTDMAPGFDEIGRKNLLRDRTASKLGSYQAADRYQPAPNKPRVPIDTKIAELENNQIFMGMEVAVLGNELHISHLEEHIKKITEVIEGVETGEMDLLEVVEPMIAIHDHASDHLELILGDPTSQAEIDYFSQALQQSGEIIMNGLRALEKARREGEVAGGDQGSGQEDPEQAAWQQKMQQQAAEWQLKMQQLMEKHQIDTSIAISEAETKRAIAEAEAAAKIRPSAMLSP